MGSLTNALVKAKNFIPNVQGKRRFEQCLKIGMMSMRTDKSDDKCENDENAPLRLRRLTHTHKSGPQFNLAQFGVRGRSDNLEEGSC